MATKKRSEKKKSAEPLSESAHRIWLAGLGALSMAEEEGSKLFRQLVEKGESFRGPVRSPVTSARNQVRETVDEVRGRAGRTVGRIESALDDRVQAVLERLGLPSKDEVADLTARVERLTRAVEATTPSASTPKRSTTARSTKKRASKSKATKKKTGRGSTASRKSASKKKATPRRS